MEAPKLFEKNTNHGMIKIKNNFNDKKLLFTVRLLKSKEKNELENIILALNWSQKKTC